MVNGSAQSGEARRNRPPRPRVLPAMLYAFPILIALMLGYIFFNAAYRLRRDRLAVARAGAVSLLLRRI